MNRQNPTPLPSLIPQTDWPKGMDLSPGIILPLGQNHLGHIPDHWGGARKLSPHLMTSLLSRSKFTTCLQVRNLHNAASSGLQFASSHHPRSSSSSDMMNSISQFRAAFCCHSPSFARSSTHCSGTTFTIFHKSFVPQSSF